VLRRQQAAVPVVERHGRQPVLRVLVVHEHDRRAPVAPAPQRLEVVVRRRDDDAVEPELLEQVEEAPLLGRRLVRAAHDDREPVVRGELLDRRGDAAEVRVGRVDERGADYPAAPAP
jgi:hypothetical protein